MKAWRLHTARSVAGLLPTLLAAACAAAQTPGVEAPAPAAGAPPLVVPAIDERRLPNGLTLAVVPRRGLPLVTLTLALRAGPEADPPGRSGVAALTATLLTKGARRAGRDVPADELVRQAESLGGTLTSASRWQATVVSMTVATPQSAAAMALLADIARRPLFAAGELRRGRTQAIDALRLARAQPGDVAAVALRRAYWGATPHGASPTAGSLRRITRADVRAFHARWFRPDNALLVLSGDLDAAQADALARQFLGDWTSPPTALAELPALAPAPRDAELVLVDMPGSGQSAVAVAAPFVAADDRERAVARVADAVLGGGYSARLNQRVRIERGLSYDAASHAESHPAGGWLVAQAQTRHAAAAQVLALIRGEIERLADAPPTADELAARQANLVGTLARRLQTTAGLAAWVAAQWAQRRPLAELARAGDEILAVGAPQVQDFARRRRPAAALRAVIAGDLAAAAAGAAAPQLLRLDLEQLERDLAGPDRRR